MKKLMGTDYYIHRGIMIEKFETGYMLHDEMCEGKITGISIYKTLNDCKNRINQKLDGTNKTEPIIIGIAGWNKETQNYFREA